VTWRDVFAQTLEMIPRLAKRRSVEGVGPIQKFQIEEIAVISQIRRLCAY
jgi:hypothetical protein